MHDWGKWKEEKVDMVRMGYNLSGVFMPLEKPVKYIKRIQRRNCNRCNKIQQKAINGYE